MTIHHDLKDIGPPVFDIPPNVTPRFRKPRVGDVLLTVDGGTSIGKPAYFLLDGDWAVDSHVAILRPSGVNAEFLTYLLASPIGQLQFQRAESGASGQTAVTEDDLRGFRFPLVNDAAQEEALTRIQEARSQAHKLRLQALEYENNGWTDFIEAFDSTP